MTQKTGAEIVDEALGGVEGTSPEPETVGRVDAPDEETAEVDSTESADATE